MKILMQNRIDAFSDSGGDTIQMLKTKEYLEKHGVEVDISLDLRPKLAGYDIVHLFNITRVHETYAQFINAKKQKKHVVVSPIYQNFDELDRMGSFGLKGFIWKIWDSSKREIIKTLWRAVSDWRQSKAALRQLIMGYRKQQEEVLTGADLLFPNSKLEVEAIKRDFNLNFGFMIVPNAVDEFFEEKDESFSLKMRLKDYVLCVGNYIERKNQLSLINAMKGLGFPLILIGGQVPSYKNYYQMILQAANKTNGLVRVLQRVSQKELASIYHGAKVVALPSWTETTGLSCLEGALAGCRVVITNRGYAREYFGEMAFYCNPADINSIQEAVIKAYKSRSDDRLKKHILDNFTWEKAALATLEGYRKICKG